MAVTALADTVLRRSLPLNAYRETRFRWRTTVSWFNRDHPLVETLSGKPRLKATIEKVNVVAPTSFCRVMTQCGSDKGWDKHNYTTLYAALFRDWIAKPVRIFEIGLGSSNPDIPFNMGENAVPGASLRAWRALFPSALVYGADIDRSILFQEERIKTFYCDQLDPNSLSDLWSKPELKDGADIIVDDGLHTFEGNTTFLESSLHRLRKGGIFIAEDIHSDATPLWRDKCRDEYARHYPDMEFSMVQLPNPRNRHQNNLLIVTAG